MQMLLTTKAPMVVFEPDPRNQFSLTSTLMALSLIWLFGTSVLTSNLPLFLWGDLRAIELPLVEWFWGYCSRWCAVDSNSLLRICVHDQEFANGPGLSVGSQV
jgi:hypothetical protein